MARNAMFPRTSNFSPAPNSSPGTTKISFGDEPLEGREVT